MKNFEKLNKKLLTTIVFIIVISFSVVAQNRVDFGIIASTTCNKLDIKIKPNYTQASSSTVYVTNIQFSVRWPISSGVTQLESIPVGPFYLNEMNEFDTLYQYNGYYYQIWAFVGNTNNVGWTNGVEKLIQSFTYTGSVHPIFEISHDNYVQADTVNGDYYFEVNGASKTGQLYSPTATFNLATPILSGTQTFCSQTSGQVYNLAAITGATNYAWTVPTGWTITSGGNSNSITVTTGIANQNGNITAVANSGCVTSATGVLPVSVVAAANLDTPVISGTSIYCSQATGQIYSISPIAGATNYLWTVPTGWSITSGANSTSITVTTGTTDQNGTITVVASNHCSSSTAGTISVSILKQWLGTVSSDWNNPDNWCSGVPTASTNVIIVPGVPNFPHITSALTFPSVCNNLTITNGATVSVDPGKALTIYGNLVVNGAQALNVKASSTATSSLITKGTVTYFNGGSVNVEKYVSSGIVSHWEYFSSPITNASSSMFTSPARSLYYVNETLNAWVTIKNIAPANMIPFMGYGRNFVTSEGDGNIVKNFVGSINSGFQSIYSLTRTESAPFTKHGWNMLGNPYPSSIDWDAASGWTKVNINGAIYFRNDGIPTAYVDGIGTGNSSGIIPPMQSFWVIVDTNIASGSLSCTDAVRVHNTTPTPVTYVNTLRLYLTGTTSTNQDDIVVRFKDGATDGFDLSYDAIKFFATDGSPQIYTHIPSGPDMDINTMPALTANKVIPLWFSTSASGTFTISAGLVSSFQGYTVFLKDKVTNIITDFSTTNSYTFTSGLFSSYTRFDILFARVTPDIILSSNSVSVITGTTAVNLPFTSLINNPDKYSIAFDATALNAGFISVVDASLPISPIIINVPSGILPGTYNATLNVKISSTGLSNVAIPITVVVQLVPTYFTTSQDIGTTLLLTWTPTSGATNYVFQYRKVGSSSWIGTPATINQFKLTNLLPGVNYECRLYIYKGSLLWGISATGNFTPSPMRCFATQDIGTTLMINWPAYSYASLYTLQYRKLKASSWTGMSTSNTQIKISNIVPDSLYEYRVYVYMNVNGSNSTWGITASDTLKAGNTVFTSTNISSTSATLTWNSYSPWATSYIFQYRVPTGNWISKTVSTNTVSLTGLIAGTTYECKVLVYIGSAQWGTSQVRTFTTLAVKQSAFDNTTNNNSEISVYPNPFINELNFNGNFSEETNVFWTIFDMTGKMVLSGNQSMNSGLSSLIINTTELSKGIYMINALVNNEKHSFRIVKP